MIEPVPNQESGGEWWKEKEGAAPFPFPTTTIYHCRKRSQAVVMDSGGDGAWIRMWLPQARGDIAALDDWLAASPDRPPLMGDEVG